MQKTIAILAILIALILGGSAIIALCVAAGFSDGFIGLILWAMAANAGWCGVGIVTE
jgi:hypothetical protein